MIQSKLKTDSTVLTNEFHDEISVNNLNKNTTRDNIIQSQIQGAPKASHQIQMKNQMPKLFNEKIKWRINKKRRI